MNRTYQLAPNACLFHADCRDALRALPADSLDSCVTDPPYALVSIVKRFGGPNAAPAKGNDAYMRASAGFMGKTWDTGECAMDPAFWSEVLRVLKPGAHLVAFGASRGYHRMACAIEDAGFEIRDSLAWLYGTGFPKSHNTAKAGAGDEWEGWGTALKPAFEPIVLARKPLSEGTVAANVLRWRTGALNIDACRIGTDAGRWPANVCHDGSDEVVAAFPAQAGAAAPVHRRNADKFRNAYGSFKGNIDEAGSTFRGDSGSAARFFYSAKASKADRAGSKHPTVKPVSLMEWLCQLVTPPDGTILDPFAGSGTTGAAAVARGFNVILCEREAEYVADICRRFEIPSLVPELTQ